MGDRIAVLGAVLAEPPAPAEATMALVVHPEGGRDHLGLLIHGQPSPGSDELLVSVIQARVQPHGVVRLEC